jgi:protein associated with RNAse G/E
LSLQKGDIIRIESWKYGHLPHRFWEKSVLLHIGEPLLLANEDVQVVESDGSEWVFPGIAICYFSKYYWFNVILLYDKDPQLKSYYCNIASPYQLDAYQKTLSYVDYDLDLTAEVNLNFRWVDLEEYEHNSERYKYPSRIRQLVAHAQEQLEAIIRRREEPFTPEFAEYWYHQYISLKRRDG